MHIEILIDIKKVTLVRKIGEGAFGMFPQAIFYRFSYLHSRGSMESNVGRSRSGSKETNNKECFFSGSLIGFISNFLTQFRVDNATTER